ncbi:MAG: NAD-dependent epimerase/dehydratase family protein, partial [Actinomycetes bacterium]
MSQVVMVTGVSRYLGGQLARMLAADPGVGRVVGVDVVTPRARLPGVEVVRADIRNPIIAKVLTRSGADTVVHMGVVATPRSGGIRAAIKDINVIGTLQLLAACQASERVRRVVVKSSTSVYGADPRNPTLLDEEAELRGARAGGHVKDSVEVEDAVRGFGRRRPDVEVTVLRMANILGPVIDTTLTAYFSMPVIPTVAGFDGRLQFLHETDALDVLHRVTVGRGGGVINIAGDGVLPVSQAVRRTGRVALPVPASVLSWAGGTLRQTGLGSLSREELALLAY